jgi:integrase
VIKTKVIKGRNPRKPWTARYWTPEQREKSFKLKSEANAFAIEMDAKIKAGAYVKATAETFGEAFTRWLAVHRCVESTKVSYRSKLKTALGPWRDRPLSEVANDRAALHVLFAEHYDGSVLRSIVTGVCDMAIAEGTLASHRLANMDLPDKSSKRRKFIPATHAQLQIIADHLGERLSLSVWIMVGTGARPGECLALESSDFTPGWLSITRKAYSGRVEAFLKSRKVNDSHRRTPVPGWLAAMVAEHIAKYGEGPLFPGNYSGNRYQGYEKFRKLFNAGVVKAGLPYGNPGNDKNFTAHMLRHVWATELRRLRIPIEDIADWGGWKKIETLVQFYADQSPEAGDEGRAKMDKAFAEFREAA